MDNRRREERMKEKVEDGGEIGAWGEGIQICCSTFGGTGINAHVTRSLSPNEKPRKLAHSKNGSSRAKWKMTSQL